MGLMLTESACRRRGTDIRSMDVAVPRNTKAMRVRTLVQISREGSSLKRQRHAPLFVPATASVHHTFNLNDCRKEKK